MDYGSLIRDAWALTWRYRFLWVLGLFTGTAIGSCSGFGTGNQFQYNASPQDLSRLAPGLEQVPMQLEQWIVSHPFTVAIAVGAIILLGLALLFVSLVAQGGMTEATVDLARNQPMSLGTAWRAGLHLFWRFLGLVLVTVAAAIVLAFLIGAFVTLAIGSSALVSDSARGVVATLWVLVGIALGLLAIPVAIGVSIVLAWAQRAIVVENAGPVVAIRDGWNLLRHHLGSSVMVWLVNVALSIGAGMAVLIGAIGITAILAAIGAIIWMLIGFTAATAIYIGIGVVAVIAALWLMEAIVNTFFWSYWTLAYLRISGQQPAAATI